MAAIAAVVITVGCGGGNEQPASESAPAASAPAAPAQAGTQAVDITFKTDPVRMGENTFEVMVMQDGKPVSDAMVTTEFFMAAMPSMNMPAMRNEAKLVHAGNGVYRGSGQVIMAGRWDVTVNVMRDGQRIGSHQLSVMAR
jgi:hypothetical protein